MKGACGKTLVRFWEGIVNGEGSPILKIAGPFLLLASYFYLVAATAHRKLCREKRLSCPVISVGNIAAGGTGKTPAVETICRMLMDMGRRPAVISRGYMGSGGLSPSLVSDGSVVFLAEEEAGDEPLMLARALPGTAVLTGRDRYEAGRLALENPGVDVIVLDDGFQCYGLGRDLDIVVVDSVQPFGNGHLLPRGTLREMPARLRAADLLVLTHVDLCGNINDVKKTVRLASCGKPVLESIHEPACFRRVRTGEEFHTDEFKGKKGLLVSGIGNRHSFENKVSELGIRIAGTFRFPDHYRYSSGDLRMITDEFDASGADFLITTMKDSVRLENHPDGVIDSAYALVVRMRFTEGIEELRSALEGLLNGKGTPSIK